MYIIFQVTLIQEIYTLPSNFFQITIWTSLQVSTESQNLPFLYCLCTNIHIHTHIRFFHYIDHIHFNFCTHIFTLLSAQKSKIAKLWKQNKINKQIGHQFRKKNIYIHTVFNRYYAHTLNTQCLLIDEKKKRKISKSHEWKILRKPNQSGPKYVK